MTMRTAGQLLREKREQLGLSFEQIERATKIRKNVLRNIELSNWAVLPSPTHVKGFIKNYGTYLGLNTSELLALFRREVDEKKTATPRHVFRTHLFRRFGLKPQLVVAVLVTLIIAGFFTYIYHEYRSFIAPPYLEILEPADNIKTENSQINVAGNTDTDAILKVNGQQVDLSPGGTFSVALNLPEGKSTVVITSENRFGGLTRVKRDISVENVLPTASPSASATTSAQPATIEVVLTIGPNPIQVEVDSDTKDDFKGLLLAGVTRTFVGTDHIRIKTTNAGSTKLTYKGKTEVMGKEGETKSIEIKP